MSSQEKILAKRGMIFAYHWMVSSNTVNSQLLIFKIFVRRRFLQDLRLSMLSTTWKWSAGKTSSDIKTCKTWYINVETLVILYLKGCAYDWHVHITITITVTWHWRSLKYFWRSSLYFMSLLMHIWHFLRCLLYWPLYSGKHNFSFHFYKMILDASAMCFILNFLAYITAQCTYFSPFNTSSQINLNSIFRKCFHKLHIIWHIFIFYLRNCAFRSLTQQSTSVNIMMLYRPALIQWVAMCL